MFWKKVAEETKDCLHADEGPDDLMVVERKRHSSTDLRALRRLDSQATAVFLRDQQLFLFGGNDSNNMLIPYSGTNRTRYDNSRGILAIPTQDLDGSRIHPENDAGEWALHPDCADMAALFNSEKLAVVQNALLNRVPSRAS